MLKDQKLTVMMPVYNGEPYLAAAIESVLAQTYRNFQFIIVNDGSTDRSADIISRYAALDSRIVALSQPNSGISTVRNRALAESRTEWVAEMNNDDIMLPHRLERQLTFIKEHPELKVAACRAVYIDEHGNELGRTANHIKTLDDFHRLVKQHEPIAVLTTGVLMHRQTILDHGGFRHQFDHASDVDLWTRLAEQGHVTLIQDEVLMKYRLHATAVSSLKSKHMLMQRQWLRACILARKEGKPEPDWETFLQQWRSQPLTIRMNCKRKMFARHFYRHAGHQLVGRNWLKGGMTLVLASVLDPVYVIKRLNMQILR